MKLSDFFSFISVILMVIQFIIFLLLNSSKIKKKYKKSKLKNFFTTLLLIIGVADLIFVLLYPYLYYTVYNDDVTKYFVFRLGLSFAFAVFAAIMSLLLLVFYIYIKTVKKQIKSNKQKYN